jgi:hypothetical protein
LFVAEYGILAGRRGINGRCMTPAAEVDLLVSFFEAKLEIKAVW